MNKELNIFYFGASAGFFLLHLILLSNNNYYAAGLEDLDTVIKKQWRRTSSNWKKTEVWPNNLKTDAAQVSATKVFFYCNDSLFWKKAQGTKILLYTDIETQLELAKLKNAWVYNSRFPVGDDIITNLKNEAVEFSGVLVFDQVPLIAEHADIVLCLQNLIKNPSVELGKLGVTPNRNQLDFIDFWVSLHPANIVQKLKS